MTQDKVVTLREKAEMLERLCAILDVPRIVDEFYPLLCEHAGEEKDAHGIVLIINQAIHEFTTENTLPEIISTLLESSVPRFIEALVDDVEVIKAATEIFNKGKQLRKLLG